MFCACPIICTYKLRKLIALLSWELEYYTLSKMLIETIPVLEILKEINNHVFSDNYIPAKVYLNAVEENSLVLHMETVHKVFPST